MCQLKCDWFLDILPVPVEFRQKDLLLVIVEILAVEDLTDCGRLKVVQRLHNRGTALRRHFAALVALRLLERNPSLGTVNERDEVATGGGLVLVENPQVRRDTRVEELLLGHLDECLDPVMVEDVLADVALARSGIAAEERRTVRNHHRQPLGVELPEDVLHEKELSVADRRKPALELPLLVVLDLLGIPLPRRTVRRIRHHRVKGDVAERNLGECVAVFDLREIAEAAFNRRERVEGVVVFRTVGRDMLVLALLVQSVGHTEQEVRTATCRVIDMNDLAFRLVHFVRDDLRHQRDDVIGGVLFSGCRCGNVGPLALDVFLKRCDCRIVIRRKINLGPLRRDLHQNLFASQFCRDSIHVQELLLLAAAPDTQQTAQVGVESLQVISEVLLKGRIVCADLRQRLPFDHDELVEAAILREEHLAEVVRILRRRHAELHLDRLRRIAHTSLQHHHREERHHVSRKVTLFHACGNQQISDTPNVALITHDVLNVLLHDSLRIILLSNLVWPLRVRSASQDRL